MSPRVETSCSMFEETRPFPSVMSFAQAQLQALITDITFVILIVDDDNDYKARVQ